MRDSKLITFRSLLLTFAVAICTMSFTASAQLITFNLKMGFDAYVVGEPISANVTIVNRGVRPIMISEFGPFKDNRIFFEISRSTKENKQKLLPQIRPGKLLTDLELSKDDGAAFDFKLSEWYDLLEAGTYSIRAVLISGNVRYETNSALIDIVPGIELARMRQFIPGRPVVERVISLVYWSRGGRDVAFLRAWDDNSQAKYRTLVLGPILRVAKPVIEEVDENKYMIYRQASKNTMVRAEIISDANGITLVTKDNGVMPPPEPVSVKKNEK